MEINIKEKNPGPQINIKKNNQEVLSSGKEQTPEQQVLAGATLTAPAPNAEGK